MTFPLRRKRRTTPSGPNTSARITTSLLGLGLLLGNVSSALGQNLLDLANSPPTPPPPLVQDSPALPPLPPVPPMPAVPAPSGAIHYTREASAPMSVPPASRPALPPPNTFRTPVRPSPMTYSAPTQVWPGGAIALAQLQGQPGVGGTLEPGIPEAKIQLEPPGPDRLFRRESQAALFERIRQEKRRPGVPPERIVFPEEPRLATKPYAGRVWPPAQEIAEPYYVCSGRLDFQQIPSERYGWELGFAQPFLAGGKFYLDAFLWPYHRFTDPNRCYECSAGYCLPGDPTPYMIYPPKPSLTGFAAQAAWVTGLVFIFP